MVGIVKRKKAVFQRKKKYSFIRKKICVKNKLIIYSHFSHCSYKAVKKKNFMCFNKRK